MFFMWQFKLGEFRAQIEYDTEPVEEQSVISEESDSVLPSEKNPGLVKLGFHTQLLDEFVDPDEEEEDEDLDCV